MNRTVAREIAVQIIFSIFETGESADETLESFFEKEYYATLSEENEIYSDYPSRKQLDYIGRIVRGTVEHKEEFDQLIEKYSKGWKLKRISHIASSLMRAAIFEVMYMDDVPNSVAINEAVELAKGYEEKETVSFINGILGSFMREEYGEELQEEVTSEETAVQEDAPQENAPQEDAPQENVPEEISPKEEQ